MKQIARQAGIKPRRIGDDALAVLQAHNWPGNIRQLRNNVERLMILARGDDVDAPITADLLPAEIGDVMPRTPNQSDQHIMALPLREAREMFEKDYLIAQINRFGGNISKHRRVHRHGALRAASQAEVTRCLSSRQSGRNAAKNLPVTASSESPKKAQNCRGTAMPRIAYVNGRYVAHSDAAVHIEDRGYQFADGVYEVCEVARGFIVDMPRHLARLNRSLSELSIGWPVTRGVLPLIMREVVNRNQVTNGLVYVQVTRGVASRDFVFPSADTIPSLVITAKKADPAAGAEAGETGIAVITVPENRWDSVDIKSVGLLPNVLAKQQAKESGAQEAWFVDSGRQCQEGASSNAWIVTMDGVLVTRPAEHGILRGITRTTMFDVAAKLGLKIEERGFSVAEAKAAREGIHQFRDQHRHSGRHHRWRRRSQTDIPAR
jgi:D-alanine transaminase